MKAIPLSQGKFALIDDEDFDLVSKYRWHCNGGYAKCGNILTHRLILGLGNGTLTDHINWDKADNRKANLRVCTPSQNIAHIRKSPGKSSKFKGVSWHKLNVL